MANPRYGNGIGWCKRGQHYVSGDAVKVSAKGQKCCIEHKFQIRNKPRAKIYKAKYYDRLKTKISTYPNT